jgi:hypothetical protein
MVRKANKLLGNGITHKINIPGPGLRAKTRALSSGKPSHYLRYVSPEYIVFHLLCFISKHRFSGGWIINTMHMQFSMRFEGRLAFGWVQNEWVKLYILVYILAEGAFKMHYRKLASCACYSRAFFPLP